LILVFAAGFIAQPPATEKHIGRKRRELKLFFLDALRRQVVRPAEVDLPRLGLAAMGCGIRPTQI
jgi:hypothetical protein